MGPTGFPIMYSNQQETENKPYHEAAHFRIAILRLKFNVVYFSSEFVEKRSNSRK